MNTRHEDERVMTKEKENYKQLWLNTMLNFDYQNNSEFHSYLKQEEMNMIPLYAYRNKAFVTLLNRIGQEHINVLDDFVIKVNIRLQKFAEILRDKLVISMNTNYNFDYEIYLYLSSEEYCNLKIKVTEAFNDKGSNFLICTLLGFIVDMIAKNVRATTLSTLKQSANAEEQCWRSLNIEGGENIDLIHRFGGWACKSSLDIFKRKVSFDAEAEVYINLLLCMRVLHDEAMNDADYKNNFYPVQIRKMNKGGLFLVKKEFFPFFF